MRAESRTFNSIVASVDKWQRRYRIPALFARFRSWDAIRLSIPELVARTRVDTKLRRVFGNWTWSLRTRDGVTLSLRPFSADLHIFHEIWDFKVYEPPDLVSRGLRRIVDVGAHIGLYSLYAATHYSPGGILAIEPEPDNYARLNQNIAANMLESVTTIEAAVVARPREVILHYDETNTGGHSTIRTGAKFAKVRGIGLREILDQVDAGRCDLAKMDCEGAEYEIIVESPEEDLVRISQLVLEYSLDVYGQEGLNRMAHRLSSIGFETAIYPSSASEGLLVAKLSKPSARR